MPGILYRLIHGIPRHAARDAALVESPKARNHPQRADWVKSWDPDSIVSWVNEWNAATQRWKATNLADRERGCACCRGPITHVLLSPSTIGDEPAKIWTCADHYEQGFQPPWVIGGGPVTQP